MTMPSEPVPKSANMPRPSRRPPELVKEIVEADPVTPVTMSPMGVTTERAWTATPRTPTPASPSATERTYVAGVMGTVNVLALVLSARLVALVAVAGAIALAWYALGASDILLVQWRTIALGIYAVAVCLPALWLSLHQARSR